MNTYYFFGVDPTNSGLDFAVHEPVPRFRIQSTSARPWEELFAAEPPRIALVGTSFSARRRFVDYISHFAQAPVVNMAKKGALPLALLREAVEGEGVDGIDTWFLEVPMHMVFTATHVNDALRLFSHYPPGKVRLVDQPEGFAVEESSLGRPLLPRRREALLASCPTSILAPTGEGAFALRVRGRATGGRVALHLRRGSASESFSYPWPNGVQELVLPVIDMGHADDQLRLTIVGRGEATVDSVELVLELALQ